MHTTRVRPGAAFAVGVVIALLATFALTRAWRADAAPGDSDATYVPIANCRLFDTRPAPFNIGSKNTPIGAGEANVLTQQVTGTNGDCTIPADAVGVSMNVTIVNPTAASNLRVFPANVATPNASNLNYVAGQIATPNKVDVKLSPDGKVKFFNQEGSVDVLADVLGYYTNSTLKEIDTRVGGLEAAAEGSGLVPFNFGLAIGESEVFGTTGPLAFEATCTDLGGGSTEAVIHAKTTEDDSVVMDSDVDSFDGGATEGFLLPGTAAADRQMFTNSDTDTNVSNYIDGGWILTASGEYLAIDGETLALGVNYGTDDCTFAGLYSFSQP